MKSAYRFQYLLLVSALLPSSVEALTHYYSAGNLPGARQLKTSMLIHVNNPTEDLYDPRILRLTVGYALHSMWNIDPETATPRKVSVISRTARLRVFTIGVHEHESRIQDGCRVVLLNAQGQAAAGKPYDIDFIDSNGDRYRLAATPRPGFPMGLLVEWQPANGRLQTLADLGIEVVTNEDGFLSQIKMSEKFYEVVIIDTEKYRVSEYALRDVLPEKNGDRFVLKEEAPVLSEWTYDNPDSHSFDEFRAVHFKTGNFHRGYHWYAATNGLGDFNLMAINEQGEFVRDINRRWMDEEQRFHRIDSYEVNSNNYRTEKEVHRKFGRVWRIIRNEEEFMGQTETTEYSYFEGEESGKRLGKREWERSSTGSWKAFSYDEQGRVILELKPNQRSETVWENEAIPEGERPPPADETVLALLEAFNGEAAPPGMRRVKRNIKVYEPSELPSDIWEGRHLGEATVFEYAPLIPEDLVGDDDSRPRTRTQLREGRVLSREWSVYRPGPDGQTLQIVEKAHQPDANFGDPANSRSEKTLR